MPVAQRCDFGVGDVIGPGFKIKKVLGNGAFGIVYKVVGRDSKEYAIKLLKLWEVSPETYESLKARFVMEYNTGLISSPNLVHSFSYGEEKGNPFIQMEYCEQGDLKEYARTHKVDYVAVARDILNGLGALHSRGKVHRDLKPENVLLRRDNTAVLTDFGISGDQNKRMTERVMGKPKQIFGTFPYMPPEQVNPPRGGQATVLPTTDIFSFGVLMYELIVGKLPFGELNESTLPRYLQNGKEGKWDRDALGVSDRSGFWNPIIEGSLRPDFHLRFQSVSEIINMLPSVSTKQGYRDKEDSFQSVVNGTLLRIMQGEDYGKVYYLDNLLNGRCTLTMGRDDEWTHNQVPVMENTTKYISRHHCTLEKEPTTGMWYIRDGQLLGGRWRESLNGTYVNSREADKFGIPFKVGDIISIGDVKMRVEGY